MISRGPRASNGRAGRSRLRRTRVIVEAQQQGSRGPTQGQRSESSPAKSPSPKRLVPHKRDSKTRLHGLERPIAGKLQVSSKRGARQRPGASPESQDQRREHHAGDGEADRDKAHQVGERGARWRPSGARTCHAGTPPTARARRAEPEPGGEALGWASRSKPSDTGSPAAVRALSIVIRRGGPSARALSTPVGRSAKAAPRKASSPPRRRARPSASRQAASGSRSSASLRSASGCPAAPRRDAPRAAPRGAAGRACSACYPLCARPPR